MGFALIKNSIVWDLTLRGIRIRIFTGLTTSNWVKSEQRVSKVEDFFWEKNQILERIEREEERLKIKAKVESVVPSKFFLEQMILDITGRSVVKAKAQEPVYVWEMISGYMERMKNNRQPGYLKNFPSLRDHFKKDFPLFKFSEMNQEWMMAWVDYLIDHEEILHNTIVRKVRQLKSVAEYARRIGHPVHHEYDLFKIKERKYHPFYLDWDTQLQAIEKVSLPQRRELIRDRFLFRCYTGIREGEMKQIEPANFITKAGRLYLKIMDLKAKKPKSIMLSSAALAIAEKYEFQLPQCSQQEENREIKEIGRIAKLTGKSVKVRHSGNRIKTNTFEICDLICTHTARRTFARRWYEQGGDLLKLSKYLGHSSIAVTERYIGVEDDETNEEMMRVMG